MKKSLLLMEVGIILLLSIAFYTYIENSKRKDTQEELENIAIEISESIYLDREGYFDGFTTNLAFKKIRETIVKVKGRQLQNVKVNAYIDEMRAENQIVVVTRIYELPFKKIVFHRSTFMNFNDKWILFDFNLE